jgi:hypothetical protein
MSHLNNGEEMTKEQIVEKVEEIQEMDAEELAEFGFTLSISFVDDKTKYFLSKAIDIRAKELDMREKLGAMVEGSEISTGDLK